MAEATGIPAVLQQLGAGEDVLPAPAEQVELFDELGLRPPAAAARPGGSRAGRRNVRNQRIASYLIARHGDPLETLTIMAQMGVEELRTALDCSRLEAWQEKRLAALATLPYLHQKQPLAVNMTDNRVVHLTIMDGVVATVDSVAGDIATIVENQQLDDEPNDAV